MAQLGRFLHTVQDTAGNAVSGASVTIYREGSTVNLSQSASSPFTVTVRHPGKIVANDTVFINTTTGTSYNVNSISATTVVLSGFSGSITLANGDRIIPSNSKPTLYADDQAGGSTANPLTSSSTGIASCWMEFGAYEILVSGGGATTTLFQALVVPSQAPGQIRYADEFQYGSTTGGIQEALNDLPVAGGKVIVSPTKTTTATTQITIPVDTTLEVLGNLVVSNPILMSQYSRIVGNGMMNASSRILAAANTAFTSLIRGASQSGSQEGFYVEDIHLDGNRAGTTTSFSKGVLDISGAFVPSTFRNLLIDNYTGAPGIYGINGTVDGGGPLLIDNIWLNPNSSSGGIKLEHDATNAVYMHGYWLSNIVVETFGTATAIEFKNSHADRFLQRIHCSNFFLSGGAGIGVLFDGVANSSLRNVIASVAGGDVVKISVSSLNTNIILEHILRTAGTNCVNDVFNSYTTPTNVARYVTAAAEDMIDFSRGTIFQIPVLATASLPAAAAAQNGRIVIEDGGVGARNLIIYVAGQRFRIAGGASF